MKSDTNHAGDNRLKMQSLLFFSLFNKNSFQPQKTTLFFMHFLYNLLQVLFPVTIRLYSRKHIIDGNTNRGCVSLLTIRNHNIVFL